MKIAIFADFPFSVLDAEMQGRGGGQAATWLPQLARAWESQGEFEIHWCVLDRGARERELLVRWNQTFHRIPTIGITAGMLLGRWPQRLAYRQLIREVAPDVIHCWGTESLHGTAMMEFDGPSILSMQGIITTYAKTGDLKGWRWKLFERWEAGLLERATLVTSESQWGLDQVEGIVPGKETSKVEYGVFPSYYDVKWTPSEERPRVLFAGGLNRLKGIDILLEMLRRHPRRGWKMVFAGAGYLESSLRSLDDHEVEVLGNLTTQQLQEEMSKAWVFVLPSRADTSPNVVKEARVVGLPVVASPHGGHAEYVADKSDGLIVQSEDPDDWFEALDGLCHDHGRCMEMGARRHAEFRAHFRPENTANQFLELYRKLGKP